MTGARGGTKDKKNEEEREKKLRREKAVTEWYVFAPLLRPLWLCNAATVWKQQVRACRAGGI